MSEYRLTCSIWLPLPPAGVFPFFADAGNLSRITPPWLHFTLRTPKPIEMREGSLLEYTIRWLGVPIRWRTLIPLYDPPNRFEDRQLAGPYKKWWHLHTFAPQNGGTLVRDEVLYVLPLGPLGPLAHGVMVRRQLEGIFNFRQRAISQILLGDKAGEARVVEAVAISPAR